MNLFALRRRIRGVHRRFREARMFAKAMQSRRHPILAHIVPIRRCNLSCAYCNEFDDFSPPVPTAEMLRRIDLLAKLGTTIITISGGEPLLHPDLVEIVRSIRAHGLIVTLITNGYLLTPERIKLLNSSGLDHLEISIDNVLPDDVSKKSLKVLDQKLRWLAEFAEFEVNINTVLGASLLHHQDALLIARRAIEMGFTSTVGILHDHSGRLQPLDDSHRQTYEELVRLDRRFFSYAQHNRYQSNLARGLPNHWHCHAGSRYLYICEDGLVHWCSQQRGYPGIPLENYTRDDVNREYGTVKTCAPYCTISCVHQTAILDDFRERPRETLAQLVSPRNEQDAAFKLPASVRLVSWIFLESRYRRTFAGVAQRLLSVGRR